MDLRLLKIDIIYDADIAMTAVENMASVAYSALKERDPSILALVDFEMGKAKVVVEE